MASANIYQALLQPPRSIIDHLGDYEASDVRRAQLQSAQMQNRLAELGMRQKIDADAQSRSDQNILATLAQQTGGDPEAMIGLARSSDRMGVRAWADDAAKRLIDQRKASADAKKAEVESAAKVLGVMKTLAAGVMANPTQESALLSLDAFERYTGTKMPPAERQAVMQLRTPEEIRRWAAGHALEADKLLPSLRTQDIGGSVQALAIDPLTGKPTITGSIAKTATPGDLLTDERARAEGAANRAVTMLGQRLTDARAREAAAASGLQYDAERGVLVDKRTGAVRQLTGPDGKPMTAPGKPLTEGQAKAVAFAARMMSANSTIADLEKGGRTVSTPGSRTGFGVGAVVNLVNSPEGRQLDQAKRDFINAVLRRESGAVISDAEFANAEQQYFPQIGDDKATVAQKARNREVAIKGMRADVPPAYQGELENISTAGSAPKPGAVLKFDANGDPIK